jgi:phosphoribosylanthranilate isomerase
MDLKICGARFPEEIAILEEEAVSYVGLWTGISGHPHNLEDDHFARLAALCDQVVPIAVCVSKPVDQMLAQLHPTRVRMVQLHGFNTPRDVALLKAAGYSVIKTLHLSDQGTCPESRWLGAYRAAGCDIFLMDRYGGPNQIGSCGTALPEAVVRDWCHRLNSDRVWLAGGLAAERIAHLSDSTTLETADVDSAARHAGAISRKAARMLVTASLPTAYYRETA